MENNSKQAPLRQAFIKFVCTALIGFSALSASAQASAAVNKDKEVTVTPVGVTNAELVFTLRHLNHNADKIYVSLADKYGDKLYSEMLSGKNLDKTFRVNSEVGTVVLVVTNTKTKAQEKFEISPRTRMVEDLSISSVY